ncbi:MAG TPA: hypothetical protein PK453_02485 [Leptospiraceae bacterium]|nr:hypothetical protein [Leptospiraceae bacterium]HMY65117.1 hypothetical protein [Leptospiraceae bacterium]HNF12508.1 hypothetical protein [Leptospiraceae bacterium]HNF23118.1 hypothetical protein [Leptospiraceae bacterium]HNI25537.1 hypothetical protein [Leptospiraceae bacterium]
MKKKLTYSLLLIVLCLPLFSEDDETTSVLPPKYLSVKNFQLCLGEKDMGTWTSYCMPKVRPAKCPAASWKQLNALTGNDRLTDCRK